MVNMVLRDLKTTINKFKTVNLDYLDDNAEKLVEKELAQKEGEKIVIDVTQLGYDKVLGKGKVTGPSPSRHHYFLPVPLLR
jgi:large subunit ribosomal protein L15